MRLIFTDGVIVDVDEAAKAAYAVADDPLSIVIVGVGQKDFRGRLEYKRGATDVGSCLFVFPSLPA